MARLLYRLGSLSARRPVATVLIWLLLLAGVAGAYSALKKPTSNEFRIPGAEFSAVFDHVGEQVPAVAGGTGTVVIHSEHPFTAAQRTAVANTLAAWEKAPHVTGTVNPFKTQATLDEGRAKVTDGQAQLRRGAAKLNDAKYQVSKLRWLVGQGRREIANLERFHPNDPTLANRKRGQADGEAMLLKADRKISAGQARLDKARARMLDAASLTSYSSNLRFVSTDNRTALAQIRFERAPQELDPAALAKIPSIGAQLSKAGLSVDYGQEIVHSNEPGGVGEVLGLVVAAITLMVMLGSLILAGLPLATAFVGVGVALLGGMSLTHWVSLHQLAPVLGMMLGLAVGIDYALFIVNRHRRQLSDLATDESGQVSKNDIVHSLAMATGTAGTAVGVAGTTVIIALVALTVTGIPTLVQMGLLAAGSVATMVLVSLTLTPALLALVGRRAVPKVKATKKASTPGWPQRWVSTVTNHAWLSLAAVIVILGIAIVPASQLRLGLPDGGSEPAGSTAFAAYEQVEKAFGAGANGPVLVAADFKTPVPKAELLEAKADIAGQIWSLPGISSVTPIGVSADHQTIAFQVMPEQGPSSALTGEAVASLRGPFRAHMAEQGISIGVTGQTAANIEISQRLAGALPLYLGLVIGLSLVLLAIVFRSLVVPVIATLGFLLSVLASFGAIVAVYQWGWLGDIFGVHRPGTVMSFMPTLLIGILFGLAMDYQMFLVSGMREAYAHGQDARLAVKTGFVSGARVVAAAGIIMVSVFGGFIFTSMTMARPIGFGLAVGVFADAFLVRMVLTPAVMHLLGDRAWWMPMWLQRRLLHVDVEGASLVEIDRARQARRAAPREAVGV